MTDETKRASEADIILECSEAAEPPEVEIDTAGPAAQLGRAVHESIEVWIEGGCVDEPEPQPFANRYGVGVRQVAELITVAPEAIAQIREDLSTLQAEVAISGGGIRGRLDGLSLCMAGTKLFSAAILDWKTGRDPWGSTKPIQRLAYASAVEATYGMPAQGYIYTAEIWLATGDIIEARFDLDMIEGFRGRLADALKYKRFSPGKVCTYCRRRYDCPGRDQFLRSAVTALAEFGPDKVTADQVAALWEQSRMLTKALKHYEAAVDAIIEDTGRLVLPDGRRLEHATKTRETIDPRKAWPVMRQAGLTSDNINEVLTINKTKLLDRIAARAPRGKKGETKKALVVALDEAGAVSRNKTKYRKTITP